MLMREELRLLLAIPNIGTAASVSIPKRRCRAVPPWLAYRISRSRTSRRWILWWRMHHMTLQELPWNVSTFTYAYPGVSDTAVAIRPTYGTASLPHDPTALLWNSPSSLAFPPPTLPLLLTTVANEAGQVTQQIFPSSVPLSNSTYYSTLSQLIDTARADVKINSTYYALPETGDGDEFRETFERLVTDGTWKCVNRDAARHWAEAGGQAWVGEWRQGVTYPDNQIHGGYCETAGRVCHEVSMEGGLI